MQFLIYIGACMAKLYPATAMASLMEMLFAGKFGSRKNPRADEEMHTQEDKLQCEQKKAEEKREDEKEDEKQQERKRRKLEAVKQKEETPLQLNILLSKCIGLIAHEQCFEIGEHLKYVVGKTFKIRSSHKSINKSIRNKERKLATWFPAEYVHLLFTKVPSGRTVMYVHDIEKFFYVQSMFKMSVNCPMNTILHCNFTEDREITGTMPRILVYDMSFYGKVMPPQERYNLLRSEFDKCVSKNHFTLQWVGNEDAADKLLRRHDNINHGVSCVVTLRDNADVLYKRLVVNTAFS
jgi:hypothetical protein